MGKNTVEHDDGLQMYFSKFYCTKHFFKNLDYSSYSYFSSTKLGNVRNTQRELITPAAAPLQRSYGVVTVSPNYQNFKNRRRQRNRSYLYLSVSLSLSLQHLTCWIKLYPTTNHERSKIMSTLNRCDILISYFCNA